MLGRCSGGEEDGGRRHFAAVERVVTRRESGDVAGRRKGEGRREEMMRGM